MKIIDTWLNGTRNYIVGISIYKHSSYCKPELLQLFEKGKTAFAERKLLEELQSINNGIAEKEKPIKIIEKETQLMPDSDNEILQALKNEWVPKYQAMNYKRHSLDKYTTNSLEDIEARKILALEILALEQECIQIWDKRDYYEQYGELPFQQKKETEDIIPEDPIELAQFIQRQKSYIRRHRLNVELHPDKPEHAEKLATAKRLYKQATGKDYVERKPMKK
jgi:hypothetical protein